MKLAYPDRQISHPNAGSTGNAEFTIEDRDTVTDRIHAMESLVPKRLRNKAKILLHHLVQNEVPVDKKNRIVFDGGVIGPPLIDLVLYAVAPTNYYRNQPKDYDKFSDLLENTAAPKSAYNSHKKVVENSANDKSNAPIVWKNY